MKHKYKLSGSFNKILNQQFTAEIVAESYEDALKLYRSAGDGSSPTKIEDLGQVPSNTQLGFSNFAEIRPEEVHTYAVSLSSAGGMIFGTMDLSEKEYNIVRKVVDTCNWDDVDICGDNNFAYFSILRKEK